MFNQILPVCLMQFTLFFCPDVVEPESVIFFMKHLVAHWSQLILWAVWQPSMCSQQSEMQRWVPAAFSVCKLSFKWQLFEGLRFILYSTGPEACIICAWGFLWVAGEAAGQTSGGAQSALRGAGSRGDAEDYPTLQQLQHTGEEKESTEGHQAVKKTKLQCTILITIILFLCRNCWGFQSSMMP